MAKLGLTLSQVLSDKIKKDELISLANRRLSASDRFYKDQLDSYIRFFKIYRAIIDSVDDSDEPNTGVNYAFGVIEDATSALSESILNTSVPVPALPKRADHEKAAENFNAMVASYLGSAQYLREYPTSVRERMICGNSWECDSWMNRWAGGRRWTKAPTIDNSAEGNEQIVSPMREEPLETPIEVGYRTRFPSIFNMRPQPYVTSVEKMKWLIEIEERVALEDLRSQMVPDPSTGQRVPFFNLDEIMAEKIGGKIIRPSRNETLSDHQEQLRQINGKQGSEQDDESSGDVDEVLLVWHVEPDRIFCVANGTWLIAYFEDMFHRPRLPYRLKTCTPQPSSLYGIGLIEPAENMFGELDDIHKLAMRNWVRIINRMIAYNPDSVPHAENDFKPRAGGRIRVRPPLGGSVAGEILPIDMPDVARSMLTMESNTKGLVERALGITDFAPGVEGTKQDHDTLGGLEKIEAKARRRHAALRRQELASFVAQMDTMEMMHSQFLVDKTAFAVVGPDGSTQMSEMDLWDIDTGGLGFRYAVDYDPAYGDDALARQQGFILLEQAIKYNNAEASLKGPNAIFCEISEIMRRILKNSGYRDTSNILRRTDGVKPPDVELQMMMQGLPTPVQPLEDLVAHYSEHIKQFAQAQAAGNVPPDLLVRLQAHISGTGQAIQAALQNPEGIIKVRETAKMTLAGPAQQQAPAQIPGSPRNEMSPRAGMPNPMPSMPTPARG